MTKQAVRMAWKRSTYKRQEFEKRRPPRMYLGPRNREARKVTRAVRIAANAMNRRSA